MAFHLIGLGLGLHTTNVESLNAIKDADRVYLENYTVNFPYDTSELDAIFGVAVEPLDREDVENESILEEAKSKNVVLLVYGDSLSATTHTQLILSCKNQDIPYKVYHNASIMTAIANTGLQLYKFGKTASMPKWDKDKNYEPTSFIKYYRENEQTGSHTLILTDIGLDLNHALYQLQQACNSEGFDFNKKIILISHAGIETQKIYYDNIDTLAKIQIEMPFCIIIPGNMHFLEEEALESFKEKL